MLLAVILLAAPLGAAAAQPAGMRTVLDPGGRFSISLPDEWEVQTSASSTPTLIGAAPKQPGEFRINVNVVVDTLPEPLSPRQLAQTVEPQLRTILHEFSVVQESPAQIGGRPAYYLHCTWRTNTGVSLYQIQAYFAVDRTGYAVTGSTLNDPDHIRADVPLLTRIIESFRVTVAARPGVKI